MIRSLNETLTKTEKAIPVRSCRQQYVDIHCHCLPGVDDGPAAMDDALALCRALVNDGIETVIATPHQLGRFNHSSNAENIREAVRVLNEELESNDIILSVIPGADIRVDERICQMLKTEQILTLADGGRYILLELPHEIFIDIEPLLDDLGLLGIQAVISHPERHSVLSQRPDILRRWLTCSAHLQVTAGSLLGVFGQKAQDAAWNFLSSNLVSFVATDSHNLKSRRPRMSDAFERIDFKLGKETACLVCIENPLRVIQNLDIVPVCSMNAKECSNEREAKSYC
ncbi:tyrosine-protein phosphatase [Planctomycetota bacterium]